MNFLLELVTPPDDEPVTLDDAKSQIRTFAGTDEDALLTRLLKAGREWVEQYTGRSLIEQQWRLTFESMPMLTGDVVRGFSLSGFTRWGRFDLPPSGEIQLRRAPVISIDSFVSVDSLGNETTVDAASYELREKDSKWPRLFPVGGAIWFAGSYRIVFTSGYSDEDLIPACFKNAILLHAEAHYDRDPDMMQKLLEAAKEQVKSECSNLQLA